MKIPENDSDHQPSVHCSHSVMVFVVDDMRSVILRMRIVVVLLVGGRWVRGVQGGWVLVSTNHVLLLLLLLLVGSLVRKAVVRGNYGCWGLVHAWTSGYNDVTGLRLKQKKISRLFHFQY